MLNIKERLKSIKQSKKKIWLILAVLIIIVVVVVFLKGRQAKSTTADVFTAAAQRGTIQQTIEGTGTLQPSERFVLKSKTDGTIQEVMVTEGTQVKKGDPILSISNEKVDSQSKQASIQWELAQNDYNDLLSPPGESDSKRRSAQLKVEQYQIALTAKQEQLADLLLKAPFDGTILSTELQVGQKVNAGQTAIKFATSSEIEVVAQFDEKDISSISTGMETNIYVKGIGKDVKGKVKEIAFSGDKSTGKFEVIIALDQPDDAIREGMQTYNTVIIANDPKQEIFIYKQGPGYIRYAQSDEMVTEVSGTVAEILQQPGTKVYKGEPLLRLSNPELERQLKEAELQLQSAQEDLNQVVNPDADTIKQQELKVLQSYDSFLTAKEKSDSLYVSSPIDGIVMKLSISPGEELSSEKLEQELVVISSFQQTELDISVDELDINKVKMDQEATIAVDALPNTVLKGRVIGIAYEGTTTNDITKYNVTLSVDYAEGIKGGMSATATISLEKKENVLRVPAEAVTTAKGRSTIRVMVNGQPQTKAIEIGLSTDQWVEVTNGLQEGDLVVVASATDSSKQGQIMGPGIGGAMSGGAAGGQQRNDRQTSTPQSK